MFGRNVDDVSVGDGNVELIIDTDKELSNEGGDEDISVEDGKII